MRYLSGSDTATAMPALAEQLDLAEAALVAVESSGEVPAKSAVHPRPAASIVYAMPAALSEPVGGVPAALGIKWVSVFPDNPARGLRAVEGLAVVNDPATGVILGILDATGITASRTAAVSGVAFRRLRPDVATPRVALIGTGKQGRAHVPMLAHVAPGLDLVLYDRHGVSASAVADEARSVAGVGSVSVAAAAREAVDGADVVVTAASFGPQTQLMPPEWLTPHALVVTVDYDTYASAGLARTADLFLTDELGGYDNSAHEGHFSGFPRPATLGSFLLSKAPRPPGRVLVSHLGMGLTDLVFATAILARAERLGLGISLPWGESA